MALPDGASLSHSAAVAKTIAGLTRPAAMDTDTYICGTAVVDGRDAWSLFSACAAGDLARVQALLDRDPALVNAQYWYQFPLHMAAREGHVEIVHYLLQHGADAGKSCYQYNAWDKLLAEVSRRGQGAVRTLIEAELIRRFNYQLGFVPLREAIKARDRGAVDALLSRHPDLARAADALGNTGLHWAVLTRQLDLIDRFIDLGVAIDAPRADGQTPLMVSVNGDYWYRWARDLSSKAIRDPAVITGYLLARGGSVTLGMAAAMGDVERMEKILAADPAAINRPDAQDASVLYYAARSGRAPIVQMLLECGADPNRPEHAAPRGRALHEAASKNEVEMVRALLDAGADPNGEVDSSGNARYINQLMHPDRCEAVQQLLQARGAYMPPYHLDNEALKAVIRSNGPALQDGQFIHEVLGRDDPELIDLLLAHRLDLVTQMSPTDIWGGNVPPHDLLQTLIDHGLDIGAPNWIGRTFLHVCAHKGRVDTAAVLLDAGADIDAIELEFGGTALAEAVRENQREMVEFLLARGADPRLPAGAPWATPLSWADARGYEEIADLLRAHHSSASS
jgi:ankyrin repeat protein